MLGSTWIIIWFTGVYSYLNIKLEIKSALTSCDGSRGTRAMVRRADGSHCGQ